jgi:hypothetical protein
MIKAIHRNSVMPAVPGKNIAKKEEQVVNGK